MSRSAPFSPSRARTTGYAAALAALALAASGCAEGSIIARDGAYDGDVVGFDGGDAGCRSNAQCTASPSLGVCDARRGVCVQCSATDDRCAPADHCDPTSFACAPGCRSDMGCASPTPFCDTAVHACVECRESAHCLAGSACNGGRCTSLDCPAGFADCNRMAADRCEANLATDPANCGSCGAAPPETCNLRDDDCDGMCDEIAGCRVGVHRSVGAEHFYTTSRDEAVCCGYRAESYDFYFLYAAPAPGTVPFYRCYDARRGRHSYTIVADCEGWGAVESVIGHIGTATACGATPLYRLFLPASNDHFYTTSAPERASAMASGYQDRGLAGFVWLRPM